MKLQRLIVIAAVASVLAVAYAIRDDVHGWSLVMRGANQQGVLRRLADLDTVGVDDRLIEIPVRGATVRARVYEPRRTPRQTVLLVSGLHPTGINETRLMDLARKLAEADVVVVTPDIPELSHFEITPLLTDRVEDAASWLAADRRLAPTGRIGLMGISFSGGLAIVAAGRPSLRDHLSYVFALGGHDDLVRVVHYLCGTEPAELLPHDYGVAVVLQNVAGELVPPEQVPPLKAAVRRFLEASYLDGFDKPAARREFAALRDLAAQLPEPAATLLRYVNDRDVERLGPLLAPHLSAYAAAAALSPARSPLPSAPVYLLHGRDDTVIPASESRALARRLEGHAPVHLLITDLISHADADRPAGLTDVLAVSHFWGELLAE